MALTLTPEVEAKLIRFASSRGLAPADALGELLDEIHEEENSLTQDDLESLQRGVADSDAGRVQDGRAQIAEVRAYLLQRRQAKVSDGS